METVNCTPCCTTPQSVNIPGVEGDPGIDGTNGQDAYTYSTANFVIPAIGTTVPVSVVNALWMQVLQVVVFSGPASFTVVSVDSATSATLRFRGFTGDLAAGGTISSGTGVGPGGLQGVAGSTGPAASIPTLSVYAAGTAYQLTATPALLDFGTTDPTLTLTVAGTYLLTARVRYDYTGATFAAPQTVTTKLRRTNNTPADLPHTAGWATQIITTKTFTAMILELPQFTYVTAATTDIIQLWADVAVVPGAGSLDAVEASIVAIQLA